MTQMTSRERMKRMYEHREADRAPITDHAWPATVQRWRREGMPESVSFIEFFDLDRISRIRVDNSPRYECTTLEETDEYRIYTTAWGVTMRQWKHQASTPEFLDYKVRDPETWKDAKARMKPTPDRVPWDKLNANYKAWREEGHWIQAEMWFGFDVAHAWMAGTETVLVALAQQPEWCVDMFNHFLDVDIALLEMVWGAGYQFDSISWPDDMGYNHNQFFSLQMYRDLLKPVHQRAIDWAHAKRVKTHLHSCGDIRPFIPEFVEMGLDGLNPLEVKAGVDPIEAKKQYGGQLLLHGGINAVLWDKPHEIEAEIRRVVPAMKQNGGYIFSSDHSVPSSVSLQDFRRIMDLAKGIGKYE